MGINQPKSARKSQVSDSDVRAVLEDPDLEFDLADDNALILPEDDPHKDLIDEIKKSIESEKADCMESEKLLLDVQTKLLGVQFAFSVATHTMTKIDYGLIWLWSTWDSPSNEMPPTADDYSANTANDHQVLSPAHRDSALMREASPERPPSTASTATTSTTSLSRLRPEKMCPVCEQTFASVQSMRRHVQRKHPDRLDECQERGLQEDKRSLPFVCDTCSKSFATQPYLQSHIRRMHTVGKRFPCDLCQRAYPLMSELRKHKKRVHGEGSTGAPS
ncbi:zinc finger protein, partial [Aphelenchoides avenae]